MNEHRRDYAITLMCRVLRVARAGFYAWLQEPLSNHAKEDARLLDLIRDSYTASHGVYGARRIFGDLREVGEICWLHRVERLMQEMCFGVHSPSYSSDSEALTAGWALRPLEGAFAEILNILPVWTWIGSILSSALSVEE